MPAARPLPRTGSIYLDARGDERALRVSWHPESQGGVVVLSLWQGNVCTGTFRLTTEQVPDLIKTLVDVLRDRSRPDLPVRSSLSDVG